MKHFFTIVFPLAFMSACATSTTATNETNNNTEKIVEQSITPPINSAAEEQFRPAEMAPVSSETKDVQSNVSKKHEMDSTSSEILQKLHPPSNLKKNKTLPLPQTTAAYMDTQEDELKQLLDGTSFRITRYNNILILIFSGNEIFGSNGYTLRQKAKDTLIKIASVLSMYDKTHISIIGYTNNLGSTKKNRSISEKRAQAVENILKISGKIAAVRFWTEGRATEKSPFNKTENSNNNQVEIILTPTFIK